MRMFASAANHTTRCVVCSSRSRRSASSHCAVDAVLDRAFSLQHSGNGIEAGDDEELRADRKEEFLPCGRCGDASPSDE